MWYIAIGDEKMDNKKRLKELKSEKYKAILGVEKETFEKMLEVLEEAYVEEHKGNVRKSGRKGKLSLLDKLVIMLGYYREYRTMENIAFDYGVAKSVICEAITWAESVLVKDENFHLPPKRTLQENDCEMLIAIVDVTEQEIERPKKGAKNGIRARKKGTHSKPCS